MTQCLPIMGEFFTNFAPMMVTFCDSSGRKFASVAISPGNLLMQNSSIHMIIFRFEIYCRDLTEKFSDVYVLSGPVMCPNVKDENNKKYNKYQVFTKQIKKKIKIKEIRKKKQNKKINK